MSRFSYCLNQAGDFASQSNLLMRGYLLAGKTLKTQRYSFLDVLEITAMSQIQRFASNQLPSRPCAPRSRTKIVRDIQQDL